MASSGFQEPMFRCWQRCWGDLARKWYCRHHHHYYYNCIIYGDWSTSRMSCSKAMAPSCPPSHSSLRQCWQRCHQRSSRWCCCCCCRRCCWSSCCKPLGQDLTSKRACWTPCHTWYFIVWMKLCIRQFYTSVQWRSSHLIQGSPDGSKDAARYHIDQLVMIIVIVLVIVMIFFTMAVCLQWRLFMLTLWRRWSRKQRILRQ